MRGGLRNYPDRVLQIQEGGSEPDPNRGGTEGGGFIHLGLGMHVSNVCFCFSMEHTLISYSRYGRRRQCRCQTDGKAAFQYSFDVTDGDGPESPLEWLSITT